MKRFLISLGILLTGLTIYSQPGKVTSAYNYLRIYKELDKAKIDIDQAVLDAKVINNMRAWYYRGLIYDSISYNCIVNKEEKYCTMDKEALLKSYQSFCKALVLNFKDELDSMYTKLDLTSSVEDIQKFNTKMSDSKVKLYSKNEVPEDVLKSRIPTLSQNLTYYAYNFLQKNGEITLALDYYYAAFLGNVLTQKYDFTPILQAGYLASQNQQFDKSIKAYELAVQLEEKNPDSVEENKANIYVYLANSYLKKGDSVNYIKALDRGFAKHPNYAILLIEQINYYFSIQKLNIAKDKTLLAVQKDPKNHALYYNLGVIYDKEKNLVEAENNYKKAISIKPDYFEAYFNLGALKFNQAKDVFDKANLIKDPKKSNEEVAKGELLLDEALPYLEKAHQVDPNDILTMQKLKELYARKGNETKSNEMKQKLQMQK